MAETKPPYRIYKFGDFRLMPDDRMLVRDGERVPMSPTVFNLLLVLVENAGRLVNKEKLMNEVWADSFVEEGNLNRTISRLRKILGEKPNQNQFIETVPRVGYRFIAPVEVVEDDLEKPNKTARKIKKNEAAKERKSRKWLIGAALLALVILAPLSVWLTKSRTDTVPASKPPKQTPARLTDNPTREDRASFTFDGKIRFLRWQGNQPVAYIMEADGSDQRRDTSIAGLRTGLWSPDGKKVVFDREGDESKSIYLANADGSNEIKLPFLAGNMNWSPDSSRIAYQSGQSNSEIYLYTLATGQTTDLVVNPAFDSDPSFSPDGESLLFVSDRDGNVEIYMQRLDGSNLRRLTNHPAHDEFPTFSPDGTQIVFNSNREDENFDIYLMNTDGSGVRRLTNWQSQEEIRPECWSADGTRIIFVSNQSGKANIYQMEVEPFAPGEVLTDSAKNLLSPVYSPTGKKLLYVSEAEDKTGELRLIDLETKQDRLLLKTETTEMFPEFSPDGSQIVLQIRTAGNTEICLINTEGGDIRNLTNNPARDIHPAWSPDGSKIVFSSNRGGNYDVFAIYSMNADGSGQHRIYYSNAFSYYPSWSPDGKQVVFANDKEDGRTGNFEIFSIEPETVNAEKRLTFRRLKDAEPVFSPDGNRIAFASNTDGNMEIYIMNSDGSALLRVTRDTSDDLNPSWSPDGNKIIFSSNRNGKFGIYELIINEVDSATSISKK